jgi:hypothetical protein
MGFLQSKLGNSLGHIFEGLIIVLILWPVSGNPLLAWVGQSLYFLGRERRDHEIKAGINPFTGWHRGWNVFRWGADEKRDLFAPVVVNGGLIYAVNLCLR